MEKISKTANLKAGLEARTMYKKDQKRDKIVQLRSFLAPDPSFLALLFNKKNWAIMSLSALQR